MTEVQPARRWPVRDMLADWLRSHGYDGLYWQSDGEECGCCIADLAPCEDGPVWHSGDRIGCIAGYRHSDRLMYPEREVV